MIDQNVIPSILDQIPYAIESIVILTSVYAFTLSYVLLRHKSIAKMKNSFFQNLDNYVYRLLWFTLIASCSIGIVFFSKNTIFFLLAENAFISFFLISKNAFDSMNESLENCFNESKSWWVRFFKQDTYEEVKSKYLKKQTYQDQVEKIKKELIGVKHGMIVQLENELAHSLAIIDNMNEIYRKYLKNETTLQNNLKILRDSYYELVSRDEYFHQLYHELLQENYDVKHSIESVKEKNLKAKDDTNLIKDL